MKLAFVTLTEFLHNRMTQLKKYNYPLFMTLHKCLYIMISLTSILGFLVVFQKYLFMLGCI